MAKNKLFARVNAWLDDEVGGLERTMEAAQEQAAAPDIEELTPAEKRWAQEELEEEKRIEAAMSEWTEKKGKPFARAAYNVLCVARPSGEARAPDPLQKSVPLCSKPGLGALCPQRLMGPQRPIQGLMSTAGLPPETE